MCLGVGLGGCSDCRLPFSDGGLVSGLVGWVSECASVRVVEENGDRAGLEEDQRFLERKRDIE